MDTQPKGGDASSAGCVMGAMMTSRPSSSSTYAADAKGHSWSALVATVDKFDAAHAVVIDGTNEALNCRPNRYA